MSLDGFVQSNFSNPTKQSHHLIYQTLPNHNNESNDSTFDKRPSSEDLCLVQSRSVDNFETVNSRTISAGLLRYRPRVSEQIFGSCLSYDNFSRVLPGRPG